MSNRWLGLLGLALVAVAGCASPLVGGECQGDLAVCDGRCVDLRFDSNNCGGCDIACGEGALCSDGVCAFGGDARVPDGGLPPDGGWGDGGLPDGGSDGGVLDGGSGDGGMGDGGLGDGGMGDGGLGDGGMGDGGLGDGGLGDGGPGPSCDVGEIDCGGTCFDPATSTAHCGSCGIACGPTEFCAGGECTPFCDPPLTQCAGTCVDTQTNADNCGRCGMQCASGICVDGTCSAGSVGHVVLVGHDYTDTRIGMNRVAGNGVFLASGAPVRVLVYEGDATDASIAGVDSAIDQVAGAIGRTWQRTAAPSPDRVPLGLAQADVFLVYSQQGATNARLRDLGATWAMALDTFVRRGGVVVVFDGGGEHDGTWQILDAAGLLTATGRTPITGARLQVTAPGDAVAVNVPQSYRAEPNSVRFETAEMGAVVEDDVGPVVLHRVVVP